MKTRTVGLLLGLMSYLLWGGLSLYWKGLGHMDSYVVFSYRILFTVVTMLLYMVLAGKRQVYGRDLQRLWQKKRSFFLMLTASAAIAVNWLTYISAVSGGQAAQASLGYYMMPLVSIVLSVLVLKEEIARSSQFALTLAAVGVAWLVFQSGQTPVTALILAVSFGLYGLLKKGLQISSDLAMLFEASCVLVVSLPYLVWQKENFFSYALQDQILLALSGLVTAIPLLLFAEGVKRAPLNVIGFIQYINPTIQLLIAIFVYGEVVSPSQWPAFVLIWVAIGVFVLGQVKELVRSTSM